MKFIILFFMFGYGVYCQEGIINFETISPAPKGDLIMQRITTPTEHQDSLFWWAEQKRIVWADTHTQSAYKWDYDTGYQTRKYLEELDGETFIFVIPFQDNTLKRLIGSDGNIRILTFSSDKYELSKPILTLKDKGYKFTKAHCDKDGRFYAVANTNAMKKGAKLYRIEDSDIKELHAFEEKVLDFVWTFNYEMMYVIGDNGKSVNGYFFNYTDGSISNERIVYKVLDCSHTLTSIEIDNEGHLWLTQTGEEGQVIRINPVNSQKLRTVSMPFKKLTSITYGGPQMRFILVGSAKLCRNCESQEGSTMLLAGMHQYGVPDYPVVLPKSIE